MIYFLFYVRLIKCNAYKRRNNDYYYYCEMNKNCRILIRPIIVQDLTMRGQGLPKRLPLKRERRKKKSKSCKPDENGRKIRKKTKRREADHTSQDNN